MARIRSIHPGFFTDETVVTLNPQAQVFLIGLWTECDDQGVFEWKPVRLKMRLLPVSNVDVGALLEQLVAADVIKKAEVCGVQLGLVRNFRKFQRPKKPKIVHVIPPEFRTYLGLTEPSSPPGPSSDHRSGELEPVQEVVGGEISTQMEEGGGRREDGESVTPTRTGGRKTRASARAPTQVPEDFAEAARQKPMARSLPDDWQPTPDDLAWAAKMRPDLDAAEIERQTARFCLHQRANYRMSHDWSQSWRGWLLNAHASSRVNGESYEERRLREGREKIAELAARGVI